MAMIALLLSFFLELPLGFGEPFGGGGKIVWGGEDAGEIEEQGLSGGPHNIKFPLKEDSGNF